MNSWDYFLKRRSKMSRFNLLDEPWIRVMVDEMGTVEEVSVLKLFREAHHYKRLAGESVTQDFATLRFLLAILLTVYSRFDDEGQVYSPISLDEQYRQIEEVSANKTTSLFRKTWKNLWHKQTLSPIVETYLQKWHDSFYLFDESKPYAQISLEELTRREMNKKQPGSISGKNINRLISESNNKVALFSPRYGGGNNKEILTEGEIARWLLTFHGYVGLSDKVAFGTEKFKASKGWLFDIGGVYLEGETLLETLILNLTLVHPVENQRGFSQKPAWEQGVGQVLDKLMDETPIDNLAELYTNWSRAVYMEPETDVSQPFSFEIVKVPELDHQDFFLEVMTFWKNNPTGIWKDTLTPRKHLPGQAVWRSFGLMALPNYEVHRKPGVVDWLIQLLDQDIEVDSQFRFISMQADGNATSWVPVDEVYDEMSIDEHVLADVQESGWVPLINEEVSIIQTVIGSVLRRFANDINTIRNSKNTGFIDRVVTEAYFEIDMPFRQWLSGLKMKGDKFKKGAEWRSLLRKKIILEADKIVQNAGNREFVGIEKDGKIINIAIAYNKFINYLNSALQEGETND